MRLLLLQLLLLLLFVMVLMLLFVRVLTLRVDGCQAHVSMQFDYDRMRTHSARAQSVR